MEFILSPPTTKLLIKQIGHFQYNGDANTAEKQRRLKLLYPPTRSHSIDTSKIAPLMVLMPSSKVKQKSILPKVTQLSYFNMKSRALNTLTSVRHSKALSAIIQTRTFDRKELKLTKSNDTKNIKSILKLIEQSTGRYFPCKKKERLCLLNTVNDAPEFMFKSIAIKGKKYRYKQRKKVMVSECI